MCACFGGWAAGVAELFTAECGPLLSAKHKRRVFHLDARHPAAGSPAAAAVAGLSAGSGTASSGGGDTSAPPAAVEAFLKVRVPPPPTHTHRGTLGLLRLAPLVSSVRATACVCACDVMCVCGTVCVCKCPRVASRPSCAWTVACTPY